MKFISLDVETANSDLASICQIGLVSFEDGRITDSLSLLIDPEDHFDQANVSIHGISAATVKTAVNFKVASAELFEKLSGNIVATHTPFDRTAISRAAFKYSITTPHCRWIDTARVARRAWQDVSKSGFGISNLAQKFGIEFKHHDACEDARVAGQILIEAMKSTEVDLEGWFTLLSAPYSSSYSAKILKDGNPEGPMHGDVIVFTGALKISRRDAAEMAANIGCKVTDSVTKQTTLLVVGDQDVRNLNGYEKSSKHRKAEAMNAAGAKIRILTESDFKTLVENS